MSPVPTGVESSYRPKQALQMSKQHLWCSCRHTQLQVLWHAQVGPLPVNFYTSCRCRSSHQGVWEKGECEGCQKQNNVRPWHKGNNFSSLLLCFCVNLSYFFILLLFLVMVSVMCVLRLHSYGNIWPYVPGWMRCSATWGQLMFCAGWACSSRCFPIIWLSPHSFKELQHL